MWYVIRTFTGKENEICMWIRTHVDQSLYTRCFVPLYEDVYRRGGKGHIQIKRMFEGYLFLESETPEEVSRALRMLPEYSVIVAAKEEGEKLFLPIYPQEEKFLDSVLTDGLMQVSYIRLNREHRVETAIGPLEQYVHEIIRLDLHHRRAIVRIPLMGAVREVKFGLWLDMDPKLERIERERRRRLRQEAGVIEAYKPGDKVINLTGVFGDTPVEVVEVDPARSRVKVRIVIFGEETYTEMCLEDVIPWRETEALSS